MNLATLALLGTASLPLVLGAHAGGLPAPARTPDLPTVTIITNDYTSPPPIPFRPGRSPCAW